MVAEGHQVVSHTWSHQYLTNITRQQRLDQIIKNEIALTDILGFFPTYLRPPYEAMTADVLADLNALGYHVVSRSGIVLLVVLTIFPVKLRC